MKDWVLISLINVETPKNKYAFLDYGQYMREFTHAFFASRFNIRSPIEYVVSLGKEERNRRETRLGERPKLP